MTMRPRGADPSPMPALAALLLLATHPACADQLPPHLADPPSPGTSPIEMPPPQGPSAPAESGLDSLRRAYREAPIAERITIADRRGPLTSFDELIVRVHRQGDHRALRIELPSLTVYAESRPRIAPAHGTLSPGNASHEGRLVVVHNQNPGLAYVATLDAPLTPALLRAHLKPIPAPAIDLALSDPPNPELLARRVLSSTSVPQGLDLVLAPSPDAPDVPASRASITLDPITSRLRMVSVLPSPAEGPSSHAETSLTLRVDPIDPDDPANWVIDLAPRVPVPSLAMLRPLPAPFPLAEPFPITTFQTVDMLPWSLADALAPDASLRRVQERYLALVVHALPPDPAQRADTLRRTTSALTACEIVRTRLHQRSLAPEGLGPRRALVRLRAHPLVCLEAPQARRDIILDHARAVPIPPESPSRLLWTGSPSSCLQRLHTRAPVAIALLDEQTRLVRVLVVDENASPDELARELEAAIMREVNLLAQ